MSPANHTRVHRHAGSLALLIGLSTLSFIPGCKTVGPDYKSPDTKAPATFLDVSAAGSATDSSTGKALTNGPEKWWTLYKDADLDRLEELALRDSPTLAALAARIDEARARLGLARSDTQVSANLSATSRLAGETSEKTLPIPGRPVTYRDSGDNYRLAGDLAYELDLWGRVRRSIESARAQLDASVEDQRAARLALSADLAQSLLNLRGLDAELALLSRVQENRRDNCRLLEQRFKAGYGTEFDLQRGRAELAGIEAESIDLQRRRALTRDALATLCGTTAAEFPEIPTTAILPSMPAITPGLPIEVLRRRPDIASAEQTLHARMAEIGMAEAAKYPSIRLTAGAGLESPDLSKLLERPSQFWQLGPALSLPLLDGGRIKANLEAARARAEAARADHRAKTLVALREVQDALVDSKHLKNQAQSIDQAIEAATAAEQIAKARHQAGLSNYLEVLDAQRTALQYERTRVQLESSRLGASVRLAKALGGRW